MSTCWGPLGGALYHQRRLNEIARAAPGWRLALDHDQRYAPHRRRPSTSLRQVWTSEQPVDIRTDFYQAEQAWSAIRPLQKPHLPIYLAARRKAAYRRRRQTCLPASSRCGAE
ncbi:hypothetical protein LNQ52_22665 [Klebsiella pneumoniae subsp. pneumoniae]|nr:hypothetical protein [Klebsiella pneumoniae subsp. pneumoniae]